MSKEVAFRSQDLGKTLSTPALCSVPTSCPYYSGQLLYSHCPACSVQFKQIRKRHLENIASVTSYLPLGGLSIFSGFVPKLWEVVGVARVGR